MCKQCQAGNNFSVLNGLDKPLMEWGLNGFIMNNSNSKQALLVRVEKFCWLLPPLPILPLSAYSCFCQQRRGWVVSGTGPVTGEQGRLCLCYLRLCFLTRVCFHFLVFAPSSSLLFRFSVSHFITEDRTPTNSLFLFLSILIRAGSHGKKF